jgi:hypothetical protein
MAPLLPLPRVLADYGLDADAVIREVGYDPALLGDPDNTIDFAAVGRLLIHTAAVTGYPHPGLELGRRSGLGALGPLPRRGARRTGEGETSAPIPLTAPCPKAAACREL